MLCPASAGVDSPVCTSRRPLLASPGSGAAACFHSFHTHVQGSLTKIPHSDESFSTLALTASVKKLAEHTLVF